MVLIISLKKIDPTGFGFHRFHDKVWPLGLARPCRSNPVTVLHTCLAACCEPFGDILHRRHREWCSLTSQMRGVYGATPSLIKFVVWSDWKRAPGVLDDEFEKKEQGPQSHWFRNNRLPCDLNVEVEFKDRYQLHKHPHWLEAHVHGLQTRILWASSFTIRERYKGLIF